MEANTTLSEAVKSKQFSELRDVRVICKILENPEEYVELKVVNICDGGLVKIEYKSDSLVNKFANKTTRWIDMEEASKYMIIGAPKELSINRQGKMVFSFKQKE